MSYLKHLTETFLGLWCKLTVYKSCNCDLSTENQYGMTSDRVLDSRVFRYKSCSISGSSQIKKQKQKQKISVLQICKDFRIEFGMTVCTHAKIYSFEFIVRLPKYLDLKTALTSLLYQCIWKIYSDVLHSHILAYSCHSSKGEGGKQQQQNISSTL